jgi:predicted TIM-barrel fold metal-dependent hydrolase
VIIDAHHHLWDPADRSYPWMDDSVAPIRRRFDVDDLRAATAASTASGTATAASTSADAATSDAAAPDAAASDTTQAAAGTGVTATIVVQAVHDPGETAWLRGQPAPVAGVVGWTDLAAPDVTDALARLLADPARVPLVGVRHQAQDEADPDWLCRPDVIRGVRALGDAGLPFDLLVREREHAAALALVDAAPEATFVLDHAGKPDIAHDDHQVAEAWRGRMRDLAARPNVVCKVSGLWTEGGPEWRDRPVSRYVRETVELFGPERSAFGSDWPVSTLATTYADVVARTFDALADLSPDEREAVASGTARRVYATALVG